MGNDKEEKWRGWETAMTMPKKMIISIATETDVTTDIVATSTVVCTMEESAVGMEQEVRAAARVVFIIENNINGFNSF